MIIDILIIAVILLALLYFIWRRIDEKKNEDFEKRDN